MYLITGAAGFIGFHTCERLLKDNKKVYGIDNIDNYYDPNLKKKIIFDTRGVYKKYAFKNVVYC
tara:strand:+ start:1972 stop:2163 length:192 start_codon:yes stop_codon:yes gene_type:complete